VDMDQSVSPQAYRFGDEPMPEPAMVALSTGMAAAYSVAHPDRADANEDHGAVVSLPEGASVLVVADGVGGRPGGAAASKIAVSTLVRAVSAAGSTRLRPAILDGFEQSSQAVRDLGIGAGTTLAVVEIEGDRVRPYHVGDSMILVLGQRGRLKYQAIPHSPVGYAVESGLLGEDEAMLHDERHVVSNLVGDEDMRIEIGPRIKLGVHDTVLLASDGLSDNLQVHEIVGLVRSGPLVDASHDLVRLCRTRMQGTGEGTAAKPDDMTFVLHRARRTHPSAGRDDTSRAQS
jgi:serine/threonine protein phosphatase PrpC